MGKRKPKKQAQQLYKHLIDLSSTTWPDQTMGHALCQVKPGQGLLHMKRFRFQLMFHWLVEHLAPRRLADVGGGKGLLTYLLQEQGWQATVIDPVHQDLPNKYKDIVSGKRVKLPPTASVPHLDAEFEPAMYKDFDLVVGMHAHGCNVKIIDGAKAFGREFIMVP
jgi:2-polyprenyl-3-methyl-5-hydroxy-6-metoxy-1,4-benzoquinol methylase